MKISWILIFGLVWWIKTFKTLWWWWLLFDFTPPAIRWLYLRKIKSFNKSCRVCGVQFSIHDVSVLISWKCLGKWWRISDKNIYLVPCNIKPPPWEERISPHIKAIHRDDNGFPSSRDKIDKLCSCAPALLCSPHPGAVAGFEPGKPLGLEDEANQIPVVFHHDIRER